MLLATYGTFREGEALSYNLSLLRNIGKSEVIELTGIKLLVVGQTPAAVLTDNKEDKAVVELLEADLSKEDEEDLLMFLDQIEGVHIGLYERNEVDTPKGRAVIYTIVNPTQYAGCPVIQDWGEWQSRSWAEKYAVLKELEEKHIGIMIG